MRSIHAVVIDAADVADHLARRTTALSPV